MRGLVARVGQEWLLLPVTFVHEVIDAPTASRLPGAPPGMQGVFAFRGSVLALWRTDALLGVGGDPSPQVCVRVVVDGVHIGLLVDAVHGLAVLADRGPSDAWWTNGSAHLDIAGRSETVTVVDVAAVTARTGAA